MLARSFRCAWLAGGALLLVAVSAAGHLIVRTREVPPPSHVLLCWEVTRADGVGGRLFVLGAAHASRAPIERFDPAIEAAFSESQVLLLEANVLALDVAWFRDFVLDAGRIRDGRGLPERLTPEVTRALVSHLAERRIRTDTYDSQEPWLVALALSWDALGRAGVRPEYGMERYFLARAEGREILELEGAVAQIERLDALTAQEQVFMLGETLRTLETLDRRLERLDALWSAGDPDGLAELLFAGDPADPVREAYLEHVYFARNRAMATALDAWLRTGRVGFAVVGASHVAGDRGIPALLRARGHRVRQLEARAPD